MIDHGFRMQQSELQDDLLWAALYEIQPQSVR